MSWNLPLDTGASYPSIVAGIAGMQGASLPSMYMARPRVGASVNGEIIEKILPLRRTEGLSVRNATGENNVAGDG